MLLFPSPLLFPVPQFVLFVGGAAGFVFVRAAFAAFFLVVRGGQETLRNLIRSTVDEIGGASNAADT